MTTARHRAALLVAVLLLGACSSSMTRMYVLDSATSAERPGNYLGLPLATGQIVLSESPGAYSLLFSFATEEYADFTHAAILVLEDGVPYIYEMSGEYDACFVDRPTDGIIGTVKRVSLEDYAQSYLYFEILDPPQGVDVDAMVAWVVACYEQQVPFDAYFDYDEHERLYCTEFVQLALEAGGARPVTLQPVQQHESIQRLLEWFRVDRERCLPAAQFHDPQRRVAALGQLPSLTAAQAYFASKRELHERFGPDQQLGNVFQIDGWADIRLRDEVVYFQRRSIRLFDVQAEPSSAMITAAVQSLATECFGVAAEPVAAAEDAGTASDPPGDI